MGRSGQAAANALGLRGVEVVTADRKDGTDDDPGRLDGVGLLVKSPGVPGENPLVVAARARGVPVWSESELGYRLLPPVRLIGITGTKGKTTTVRLLGAMLAAAGWTVTLAGHEHRLEPIAEVDGVRYVNDSKATNVAAALRALAAYADEPVRLIAGGRGKGQSFGPLAEAIGPSVIAVYAIGEAAEEIAGAIGPR